jgi:transglutaminase-like putative cysteine protease
MQRTISPGSVRCVPPPDWIVQKPYQAGTLEAGHPCVGNGVCRLLYETQTNLTAGEHVWYCRTVQRVLTRAGAERASHFAVEFDPAYERLEVHFIRVLRGQERLEHARPDAVQVFRRETSMERLVLNGRITATLLVPDVRVNDVIEFGLTLHGSNPVLGGKHAAWAGFDSFNPWLETRHRLLRSLDRDISIKALNNPPTPETTKKDGIEELCWSVVGQARREEEALTPPWRIFSPAVLYSEFRNWGEVARLFAPSYQSATIPDGLVQEIDRLAATYADPAERAAEWLRYVQHTLRYFALALGEGGLIPRDLDAIWANRFGDCKDAARLYVAGAHRLRLDACAALVSTMHGPLLKELLPSPSLFNHCIVRVRLDGVSYWLDPTAQVQSGSLENIFQPHAGWALPLTPEAEHLELLGYTTPQHALHADEEFTFGPKSNSPAKFRRNITYFSGAADALRNRIANEGPADFSKGMLKELQSNWPGAIETAPLEISDDQVKNCLSVKLNYEIPGCWKQADKNWKFEIADVITAGELGPLNGARQTDIYLGHPRKLTRDLRIEMPSRWAGTGWRQTHELPGLTFTNHLTVVGRTLSNTKELVIKEWSIPPVQAGAYNELTTKLRENALILVARERFGKMRPLGGGARLVGKTINAIWITFIVMWLLATIISKLATQH